LTPKEKGTRFERRVKNYLLKKGYLVARSAGSLGIFDLIAIPPGGECVYGIQCKVSGRLSKTEREKMKEAAERYKIVPLFVTRDGRKLKIEEVR